MKNLDKIIAHSTSEGYETLEEHSERTMKVYEKINEDIGFEDILRKGLMEVVDDASEDEVDSFIKLVRDMIRNHDYGKLNDRFQKDKTNRFYKDFNIINEDNIISEDSNHALLGSYLNFHEMVYSQEAVNLVAKNERFYSLIFIFLYVVETHHKGFDKLSKFLTKLGKNGYDISNIKNFVGSDYFKQNFDGNEYIDLNSDISKYVDELLNVADRSGRNPLNKRQLMILYFLVRLTASVLFQCDNIATSNYMRNMDYCPQKSKSEQFYKAYKDTELYKSIVSKSLEKRRLKPEDSKEINDIRSEMFLASNSSFERHMDNYDIFFLRARVGAGKTNMSMNLAFKYAEKTNGRIFMVAPLNSIVSQTYEAFEHTFKDKTFDDSEMKYMDEVSICNSISPINQKYSKYSENDVDYAKDFINYSTYNYSTILTTHVSLFKKIFGVSKSDILPFLQLRNSIVVLDEVQNYNIHTWTSLIEHFQILSDLLGTKFIIMSGTLPDFAKMEIDGNIKLKAKDLFEDDTGDKNDEDYYFNHRVFTERINFDLSILKKYKENGKYRPITDVELISEMEDKLKGLSKRQKVVMEFIKRKGCDAFYDNLREYQRTHGDSIVAEYKLFKITSNTSNYDRQKIIREIRNTDEKVMLIGTQTIEAGIDLSFCCGFKNISIIEAEHQLSGRINRNFEHGNGCPIYMFMQVKPKEIYSEDLRSDSDISLLRSNAEDYLYNLDAYAKKVAERIGMCSDDEYKNVANALKELDFETIDKNMAQITTSRDTIRVFKNISVSIDEDTYQGEDVWNEYKRICTSKYPFEKMKIELSKHNALMQHFIFEVDSLKEFDEDNVERFGDIYYLKNVTM